MQPFPGPLYEWPDIARRELNTVIDAEIEHKERLAVNIRLMAEHIGDKQPVSNR